MTSTNSSVGMLRLSVKDNTEKEQTCLFELSKQLLNTAIAGSERAPAVVPGPVTICMDERLRQHQYPSTRVYRYALYTTHSRMLLWCQHAPEAVSGALSGVWWWIYVVINKGISTRYPSISIEQLRHDYSAVQYSTDKTHS
jgi:hypothetical protein